VGLHTIAADPGVVQAETLVRHARTAERAGFDGVTVPEHHGGFPGYMPQPLLACNWLLAATDGLWASPCPLLLTLRNPVLVAEQLAWTAAAFPARVGAAFAPGYTSDDFDMTGAGSAATRFAEFRRRLDILLDALSPDGPVEADPAVRHWSTQPGPLLRGVNSVAAARAAARRSLGMVFPGGEAPERLAGLAADYRAAGGLGAVVWIRNLWLGAPPAEAEAALERSYRDAAAPGMRQQRGFADATVTGPPDEVAERLVAGVATIGATAVNVRFHLPLVSAGDVDDQISRFGATVLPRLRAALHG
jgi:alkanesulfonate monooxygenase SsuD/methylene tetrahydromethanopterin reductase-like flavin-dependent oxidoreductase (luciferase family)